MRDYDDWPMDMDSGSSWVGALLLIAFALLALLTLLTLLGVLRHPSGAPEDPAQRILDERFARGEIDESEYQARCTALRGS